MSQHEKAIAATRTAIAQVEAGRPIHTDTLIVIAAAVGDPIELLCKRPKSAYAPTTRSKAQMLFSLAYLRALIDELERG